MSDFEQTKGVVDRMIQDTLLKYRLRTEIAQFREKLDEVSPSMSISDSLVVESYQSLIASREQLLEILGSSNVHRSGN